MRLVLRNPVLRPAPSGAGRRGTMRRSVLAVVSTLGLGACYAYTPLYTAPEPGTRVALDITDRGRVGLENNVGSEVAEVEGILTSASDSQLVLNVLEVRGLRGDRTVWAGESVQFRPEYVRSMRARHWSSSRTAALVTFLASSSIAFIATRGLFGSAGGAGPPGINPPPPDN